MGIGSFFFTVFVGGYVLIMFVLKSLKKNADRALEEKRVKDNATRRELQQIFYDTYTNKEYEIKRYQEQLEYIRLKQQDGESSSSFSRRKEQARREVEDRQELEFVQDVMQAMGVSEEEARTRVKKDMDGGNSNVKKLQLLAYCAKQGYISSDAISRDFAGTSKRFSYISTYQNGDGVNVLAMMKLIDHELQSHKVPEMIIVPYDSVAPGRPILVRTARESDLINFGVYQWNAGEFSVGQPYSVENFDHYAN